MVQNSFITALFGVFVIPVMYCAVVYIALKEMLSIMHKVPDELLSWFGGGGPQLGGYAQKLSDGSIQAFGMVNQRATNPFDRMKQGLAERQSALQQKLGNLGDKDAREESKLAGYSNAITGGVNGGVLVVQVEVQALKKVDMSVEILMIICLYLLLNLGQMPLIVAYYKGTHMILLKLEKLCIQFLNNI